MDSRSHHVGTWNGMLVLWKSIQGLLTTNPSFQLSGRYYFSFPNQTVLRNTEGMRPFHT